MSERKRRKRTLKKSRKRSGPKKKGKKRKWPVKLGPPLDLGGGLAEAGRALAQIENEHLRGHERLLEGVRPWVAVAIAGGALAAGRRYLCPRHFYLCHGRPFVRSGLPAVLPAGSAEDCYQKAWRLTEDQGLDYAEGLLWADSRLPALRAWNVDASGRVVDPSAPSPRPAGRACENSDAPAGDEEAGRRYFGVVFRPDFVRRRLLETGRTGIFPGGPEDVALLATDDWVGDALAP